jgi:hypothetical protein
MALRKKDDLTGQTIGNWKIIKQTKVNKNHEYYYLCECICGKQKEIRARGAKGLCSTSCGCKNPGRWIKGWKNPEYLIDKYSQIRGRYKRDAKTRGYSFELTKEQFEELIAGPCFYCGVEKQNAKMYNNWGLVHYTGIDRVDNSIGYVYNNCVSCCKNCNTKKKAASALIILKAYEFLKNNGTF